MIKDREDAGKKLSAKIKDLKLRDPIVLCVPRGGVVVGKQIAKELGCKMDVVISKKITPPENPEYAIGAITEDGTIYRTEQWKLYEDHPNLQDEINKKKKEVLRRLQFYRGDKKYQIKGKDVIIVDDGIATGSTVLAILKWIEKKEPSRIILAVPVMPKEFYEKIIRKIPNVVTLETPTEFYAVGQFYHKFDQVSDDEVIDILKSYYSQS